MLASPAPPASPASPTASLMKGIYSADIARVVVCHFFQAPHGPKTVLPGVPVYAYQLLYFTRPTGIRPAGLISIDIV